MEISAIVQNTKKQHAMGFPTPTDTSTVPPLHLRFRKYHESGDKGVKEPEDQDISIEIMTSIYDREDATTNSQKHC